MSSRSAAENERRARLPGLETEHGRSRGDTIASVRTPPSKNIKSSSPEAQLASPDDGESSSQDHQRFVLTDPIAFKYLEGDPTTSVIARQQKLAGYECYVVEQWATSREHPTFTITTYTGDPSHTVLVDVLGVPDKEETWSPRLKTYFRALNQYHARREMTPLGTIMVTNLSGFPSSLTVIPIPDGDLYRHRIEFFVNENLKRLGCSGRIGLTLGPPSASSMAKFQQLYHISDKNDFGRGVIELIRLCQMALIVFDKLSADYADGMLCDITEHAISDWWNDIGAEQYGLEPHDGILGPTTVAALLGLYMGARNRLHTFGAPVAKDPFDMEAMKRGVASFQKQQRLPQTRRLDRQTIHNLMKVTAKAAASDGWTVPRAVKSTVAELSGRGGEMISDAVGRRDKAGIAEIETADYDHFVHLVFGERSRWLWHGKPMKKAKASNDVHFGNGLLSFQPDQHGAFTRVGRSSTIDGRPTMQQSKNKDDPRTPGPDSGESDQEDHRNGLRKRATDLKNDAKSGFDKIKGAVTHRGHINKSPKQSKETTPEFGHDIVEPQKQIDSDSSASPFSGPASPMSPLLDRVPDFSLNTFTSSPESQTQANGDSRSRPPLVAASAQEKFARRDSEGDHHHAMIDDVPTKDDVSNTEMTKSEEATRDAHEERTDMGNLLRRTVSDDAYWSQKTATHDSRFYPKHLSFSLAEDGVLPWDDGTSDDEPDSADQHAAAYAAQALSATKAMQLRRVITDIQSESTQWTQKQLLELQTIVDHIGQDQQNAEAMHRPRMESLQSLSAKIDTLMQSEKERIVEGSKELDTLAARLNYEIDELRSRIEDVENVVDDFERGVNRVTDRVAELENDNHSDRRWNCIFM